MKLIDPKILEGRRSSIDIFRAIAILLVVLYHFDKLVPIGFIGVDLFFVISGYLVSRSLLQALSKDEQVPWKVFLIKRFTKIIPSYYFFILAGTVLSRFLFLGEHSEQVIQLESLPRYLFFYLNYYPTFNWSFELSWSLCVEEHFYLFLVLAFLFITAVFQQAKKNGAVLFMIILFILLSIGLKVIGYHYGWDTYLPTHMRMDALLMGVLVSVLEINFGLLKKNSLLAFAAGLFLCVICCFLYADHSSEFFNQIGLHVFMPISFALLIRGTLHTNFRKLKALRIAAYYSYNWYLWHAIIAYTLLNLTSIPKSVALPIYLIASFVAAVVTTKIIEEPIIRLRGKIFKKLKI